MLSYYVGLNTLLRLLKVKYRTEKAGSRIILGKDEYRINFSDVVIVISKTDDTADLILGGLTSMDKITRAMPMDVLNSRNKFPTLFSKLEYNLLTTNEIKMMENIIHRSYYWQLKILIKNLLHMLV